MITKFEEFLNENKKEKKSKPIKKSKPVEGSKEAEREKLHRKEISKYLSKDEIKELDDKQIEDTLSKRKYHGSMNDDDLEIAKTNNDKTTLKDAKKNIEESEI